MREPCQDVSPFLKPVGKLDVHLPKLNPWASVDLFQWSLDIMIPPWLSSSAFSKKSWRRTITTKRMRVLKVTWATALMRRNRIYLEKHRIIYVVLGVSHQRNHACRDAVMADCPIDNCLPRIVKRGHGFHPLHPPTKIIQKKHSNDITKWIKLDKTNVYIRKKKTIPNQSRV